MEAPDLFEGNYCSQISAEKHHSLDSNKTNSTGSGDHFMVEELLDLSNEDAVLTDCAAAFDNVTGNSTDSSTVTVVHSCGPNFSGDNGCPNFSNGHFSSDLFVPYDDLAELEWLSNIVEESFSCEDLQKLQLISGMKARYNEPSETRKFQPATKANRNISVNPKSQIFNPEMAVPGKPRSKRPRAAPFSWASRLLASASSFEPGIAPPGRPPPQPQSKKESVDKGNGEGRKCLHCANDKTPQWRTGPMGPKTLCNACGVRYKSGRLVPEYRPAASPTFVLTKHSNSHRKVLELRRQKEVQTAQQQQQNVMFDLSNGDDYSIHQQAGPDFR